VTSVGQK